MRRVLLIAAVAALSQLAACTEKVQTATPRKTDEKVWQSSDNTFTAAGYKAGDKSVWDDQSRARAQFQNEYLKTK